MYSIRWKDPLDGFSFAHYSSVRLFVNYASELLDRYIIARDLESSF